MGIGPTEILVFVALFLTIAGIVAFRNRPNADGTWPEEKRRRVAIVCLSIAGAALLLGGGALALAEQAVLHLRENLGAQLEFAFNPRVAQQIQVLRSIGWSGIAVCAAFGFAGVRLLMLARSEKHPTAHQGG